MNYNYLRYFSVLAQVEHYTLAAARLGISQPSLSSAIHHLETELGGVRFLVTHGHKHDVKTGLLRLCYAAAEAGAQVAVFGHTHQALTEQQGNLWLLNPGAASGGNPSYGVVELQSGQVVSCRVEYL